MGSWQLAKGSGQGQLHEELARGVGKGSGSWQRAVGKGSCMGSWQLAKGSWQGQLYGELAVGKGQWARAVGMVSGQWAVGSGQWAVRKGSGQGCFEGWKLEVRKGCWKLTRTVSGFPAKLLCTKDKAIPRRGKMFIERDEKPCSTDQSLPFQKILLMKAAKMDHFIKQTKLILTKKL